MVVVGEFVGGAFLGAALGTVLKVVVDAAKTALSFKSNFKRMESILIQIAPTINEIEHLNKALNIPEEETSIKELERAAAIVKKCVKVRSWNCCKRYHYSSKLQGLEKLLDSTFNIVMQAQVARDVKVTQVLVRELTIEWRRFIKNGGSGPIRASFAAVFSSVGPSSDPHVGLEVAELKRKLKNDLFKQGAEVLALTALGGCGKTTLVKSLCRDKQVQEKFGDNILFVTVTKTADLQDIARRIFRQCGELPDFLDDKDAINQVEVLLRERKSNPILLILDDVWSGSESLIEKFMFRLPDYKILVSSRFEFPRFGHPHRLETLNDKDAMSLFCHFAENYVIQDQNIVKKIVKCCKGLPLALKVVGRSLSGQPPSIWRAQEMEFSEGVSVFESNDEVLDCLKKTLDTLSSELREFYMDLGSFPEDEKIPVSSIIDMWAELYGLDGDGVLAISYLYGLSYRNLLNLGVRRRFTWKDASKVDSSYEEWFAGEVDHFYNEHSVTLHDILRDIVTHDYQNQSTSECVEKTRRLFVDAGGNNFPSWWLGQKPQHISARLLSISTGESFSSTWCDLQPPEVEVLVLNFRSKKYDLPEFIKKMEKLKVLIITNYGLFNADLGRFSVLDSLSNLKRLRLENVSIPSLEMPTLPLTNLRKLSLVMCNNVDAFCNGSIKLSVMMPNLVEIDIDYCDDLEELPDGLCDILTLKKLSVTNCHMLSALPDDIGKLVNLEVLRLSRCSLLSELPDAVLCLSKLTFLDISESVIRNLPREIGKLQSLRKFSMSGCSNLKCSSLLPSLMKLKQLEEVRCDHEEADFQLCPKVVFLKEEPNLNWL